jgi:hypothetical protein
MRVERGEHAADGGLDQLFLVDLFDIDAADSFKDVAEQVKIFIGRAGVIFLRRQGRDQRGHADHSGECTADGGKDQLFHRLEPLFSLPVCEPERRVDRLAPLPHF